MKNSTFVAIVVFVALAVAAVLTLQEKPQRGVSHFSLENVDVDAVDRVVFGADEGGIDIEKKDGGWTVDGLQADGTAVERIIESLAAARSGDLASRNPERYAELEVDDEKGTRVRLFSAGKPLADVVIGAPTTGGSYLRSGDDVYAVRGIYRASFAREREGWVERRLFFDDVGDVDRVEVALVGEQPYVLIEKDDVWQLEDPSLLPAGQRFDGAAASRLVRSLVTARAAEVLAAEPENPTGLGDGADTLTYRVAGDETPRVLTIGAANGDEVYARSSARHHLLTLRKFTADGLHQTVTDLRDLGFAVVDPMQVKRLAIERGDERLVLEQSDGTWQVVDSSSPPGEDFSLDPSAVMRRLAAIDRAVAVAEAAEPLEPAEASARLTVTTADDAAAVVAFGPEIKWQDRDVVPVTGNLDERTYLVEKATRDQLLAGLDSFKQTASAPAGGLGNIDPAALQNLPPEVRQALMKQMAEQQQRQGIVDRAMEAAGK